MKHALFVMLLSISIPCLAVDIAALNPIETIEIKPEGFKSAIKYNITLPQKYEEEINKNYFVLFDMHPRSQPFISGMHDWLSHNGEWPWLKTIVVTPADYNSEFAGVFKDLVANPSNQLILDIIQQGILKKVDEKEDEITTNLELHQLYDMTEDVVASAKIRHAEYNLVRRQSEGSF